MIKIQQALCITILMFLTATAALHASSPVNIFGLKDRSQLKTTSPEHLYLLQLGAFEQPQNASRYKAHIEHITQQPAHITVKKHDTRTLHYVFMGPLDKKTLQDVSHALLHSEQKTQQETAAQTPDPIKKTNPSPSQGLAFKKGHMPLHVGFFNKEQSIGTQSINIQGLIGDRFTVTHQDKQNILLGFGYFLDGSEYKRAKLAYGVNAYYLARTKVSGDVYQEHLFNNLSYQYTQTNIPIYASAKAGLKTKYEKLSLLLNTGIGPNIMQTSNFSEASRDGGRTLPDKIFTGKTNVNFSATAGIGARLDQVLGNVPFECGYQFFYLGDGAFDRQTDQVMNTLKTGTSYAQALICSVTL
ncbi:MAG: SPOR domain-containing protein [Legionellaceae bacterium]|nr:SPOR domain-containing protein [Legionellaceae bacterium]